VWSLLRESNAWYESINEVLVVVWSASACDSASSCVEAVEESEVPEVMRCVLVVGVCRPRVMYSPSIIGIFWIRTVLSVLQYPC